MESQQSDQTLQLSMSMGLDGPPLLSNISSVMTDADGESLNLIDIPLSIGTFNGLHTNLAFSSPEDYFGSPSNVILNGMPDSGLNKMSDTHFLTSVDGLSKGDTKSPLNIMVVSDGIHVSQVSPALPSQPSLSSQPLQSVVSGGDKMLSAVNSLNFNDPEILGDAAFDSTPSGTLPQFDDGLLSALGSAGQGLRLGDGPSGTSFDLFDGGVGDSLSLSPQPFSDAVLLIQDTSQSVLDTGLSNHPTDSLLDTSVKQISQGKKSPASAVSPDPASQSKFNNSQCPVCGKTFNNITALAKHRLTHSDERKYVCNVCSKGFKRQDHLNGHRMTHLDKKPFECQVPNCDKGYCDQRSLRRHLEQHHHLDPETIQNYVQASMAAVGISPPTPRGGNKKSSDKSEGRSKNINSPVYSPGSATPTPSPGSAGTGNNLFHFDPKKQQQQQNELLVQQIHQQQKAILQQQKLQKQQEEATKMKESIAASGNEAMNKQVQLQLQVQQKQPKQQQNQKQPADMVAVIQQVQKLQQKFKQQQQSETQKSKTVVDKDASGQQGSPQWQDKAGVYTFVGTPTSNEQSPISMNNTSPVMPNEILAKSPVSPVTIQPISPMTNIGKRAVWLNSSPDSQQPAKEEPPKPQAYCVACDRYFKNAAALNGHMRCHGGFSNKGKGVDKKSSGKKSANSSSEMGPPLRPPPHASTPSPQSMMRTSPTIPTCSSSPQNPLTPTSAQSPGDQSSAIDKLNGNPVSEQLMQNKHKHLQEQLSSHLLKRRISGDQLVQQQRQIKNHPNQIQSNQEQMRLLEDHINAQRQQQQQQHQQTSIQLITNQIQQQEIPLQIGLSSAVDRPMSPQQGEQIQRIIQSFQQVEELHRQQQQQLHLSPEQLEQIRQEHKLIGLPPLNPEQLQYQLQDQQNQIIQAQIREQQLQEQQNHQLQVVEPTSLVMTSSALPLTQSGLIQLNGNAHVHGLAAALNPQTLVKFNYQPTSDNQVSNPSQAELSSSVQHILATLDPVVVNAAGLNQQQILAQLQKQQRMSVDAQNAQLVQDTFSSLQVNQIPQILLQPPSTEDINGIPTISIPESVVLGTSQGQGLNPTAMETEQQQIERIQNGLMASAEQQQQDSQLAALSGTDISTLSSFGDDGDSKVPNFLNIQPARIFSSLQAAPVSQPTFNQLRESSILEGSSLRDNNPTISSSSLLQSLSSPATSSAIAKNTDAAVAQILRNINNSLAESGSMGLNFGNTDIQPVRSSVDGLEYKLSTYPLSSVSPKHFLGSIKQDVMLSSAVDSNRDKKNGQARSNDSPQLKEVPYSTNSNNQINYTNQLSFNNKRRLSADLESQRRNNVKSTLVGMNPLTTMVNPLEVEGISSSASSGRVRARSKSGDVNLKYMRSKSVDHPSITDSLFRANKRTLSHGSKDHLDHLNSDLFSRSDGADVFRNPSSLPSPLKIKRKHRPAPLYIPPQFGIFQSRLRSPRVIGKDGHLTADFGRGHTPPPYTPPPMLSPFRSGSGLFCSIQSAFPRTPGSAPVSSKYSQSRRGSLANADGPLEIFSEEQEETQAPETDTQAHINIGVEYQAVLPEYRDKSFAVFSPPLRNKSYLLWSPPSEGENTDAQLQSYQEFACSAAVKGNGCNVEYALHLLHLAKGDLSNALLMLMAEPPSLPYGHPMLSYKYQETDAWNSSEMDKFSKAILGHDKDFFKIAKEVETKTVKQCVQFYYMWKKVCLDDYKRLRHSRNKQSDYNTRRQTEKAALAAQAEKAAQSAFQGDANHTLTPPSVPEVEVQENSIDSDNISCLSDNDDARSVAMSGPGTAPSTANSTPTRIESPVPAPVTTVVFTCTHEGCNVSCSSKQSLKRHMRKHQEKPAATSSPVRKPRPSTPSRSPVYDKFGEEIFPCRLCGRVFAKVKSRSAHMKSHKVAEQAQQEKKASELAEAAEPSSVFVTH